VPPARWFPQTDDEWDVVLNPSLSLREKSRRLGVHATTVKRIVDEVNAGLLAPGDTGHATSSTTAQRSGPPEPEAAPQEHVWMLDELPRDRERLESDLWLALERVQQTYQALDPRQEEVSITLPDDGPVMIVMSSDWHVGHTLTDMTALRIDLETIRDTPGVYAVLGGDLFDNVVTAVAGRGMHHEQLTPAQFQQILVDHAVSYLGRENVLAMVLGNHDEWSDTSTGWDPIAYLARKLRCAYLGHWGFLNITLGRHTYRILAAHKFRMSSSFNKTHMAKRAMEFLGDADAVLVGDKHDPAVETAYVRRMPRFFGQAGTYLRSSRYGRSLGFTSAPPTMPGVILFPDTREIVGVFDALGRGIHILNAFRGVECHCRYCQRGEEAA